MCEISREASALLEGAVLMDKSALSDSLVVDALLDLIDVTI